MPVKIKTWHDHVCCMVCKMRIMNDCHRVTNRPWEAKFRALHNTQDGVKLTGLGLSVPGYGLQTQNNKVPNSEHARWDSMGRDWSPLLRLNGYAFHDRCWNLIMEHFRPWEFDFKSLYEALECLPWPQWPWTHETRDGTGGDGCDPFVLPTLEQLMQPSKPFPASPQGIAEGPLRPNPTDPFNVLPLELRQGIAMQLPTHDVLNLRCASKAMVLMFWNTTFWKTRFAINGERGYAYPLVKDLLWSARNDIDWRLLYYCTCKIKCGPDFDFHIRIWESLRWLRDATLARYFKMSMPLCFGGRAMQHYHNTCYPGTHIETVDITPSLYEMAASTVSICGGVYVTGLEFFFSDQPSVLIGYKAPGAQVKVKEARYTTQRHNDYKYPGIIFKTHIKRLRGFTVCREPSGVQALGIIQCPKSPFHAGYRNTPLPTHKSEFYLDTVSKVIGTFDHYRMVDLGILGTTKQRRGNAEVFEVFN